MRSLIRRRPTARVATLVVVALSFVIGSPRPHSASAQLPGDVAPVRPIRIEGYWGRDRGAPGVLDGIQIASSDGGPRRTFGVTALQAYKPEEEGVQVLRHSELRPSLRLLGQQDMVRRFMNAPTTAKVVAVGVYRAGSDTITLNSVEVAGENEKP